MSNIVNKVRVSVCMSTYNHEDFIVEALRSVLMQECNFDYEIILSNDKSTDRTHQVISEYIKNHPLKSKIHYFNQEKNLGMNGNLIFTLKQAKGEYISLLEGDDYWTDIHKLQKQFEFLEKNQDYTICTAAYVTSTPEEGLVISTLEGDLPCKTYAFDNFTGFKPHYLNMFFRKEELDITKLEEFNYSGDNVIFIMCLAKGKGYFVNEVYGFRRDHPNGAWSSKSLMERLEMSSKQFIGLYRYPEYKKAVRPILFYYYADLIASNKKGHHYISESFKVIKTRNELMYFIKKVLKHYIKL